MAKSSCCYVVEKQNWSTGLLARALAISHHLSFKVRMTLTVTMFSFGIFLWVSCCVFMVVVKQFVFIRAWQIQDL